MVIRAGLLNRRVRLERAVEKDDSYGQAIKTWLPVEDLWARVEPLGGREGFGQQQFVATGDLRITVRWRPNVTVLNRIVHDGRPYDIVSVAEVGRREELLIVVKARVDEDPS